MIAVLLHGRILKDFGIRESYKLNYTIRNQSTKIATTLAKSKSSKVVDVDMLRVSQGSDRRLKLGVFVNYHVRDDGCEVL